MKFLYTSDLHGKKHLYQELLDVALVASSEIVILGGDLLPSHPSTKRYEDMLPSQKQFSREFLSPFFRKILTTTTVKRVFLIPGNWDSGYPYLLQDPVPGVVDLSQTLHRLENGYELIGYPFVPPTPFRPKDFEKMDDLVSPWPPQKQPSYVRSPDRPDQLTAVDPYLYLRERGTINEDLDSLPKARSFRRTILVMHSPPFGTRLDGVQGGRSAGSRSLKAFILENQPLLALCGHIHEAPELSGSYVDLLGETICVNPGQFTSVSPNLHAVTFEIEKVAETLEHTYFSKIQA